MEKQTLEEKLKGRKGEIKGTTAVFSCVCGFVIGSLLSVQETPALVELTYVSGASLASCFFSSYVGPLRKYITFPERLLYQGLPVMVGYYTGRIVKSLIGKG